MQELLLLLEFDDWQSLHWTIIQMFLSSFSLLIGVPIDWFFDGWKSEMKTTGPLQETYLGMSMDPQFSQWPLGSNRKNPGVNPILGPVTGPGLSIALMKATGSGPCSIVVKGSIW